MWTLLSPNHIGQSEYHLQVHEKGTKRPDQHCWVGPIGYLEPKLATVNYYILNMYDGVTFAFKTSDGETLQFFCSRYLTCENKASWFKNWSMGNIIITGNATVMNSSIELRIILMAKHEENVSSTLRTYRTVTQPSTIRALRGLTSEFRWDPVHSTQYGRWQNFGQSWQSV